MSAEKEAHEPSQDGVGRGAIAANDLHPEGEPQRSLLGKDMEFLEQGSGARARLPPEPLRDDRTRPLPLAEHALCPFPDAQVAAWTRVLREDRILILSSVDAQVTLSAMYAIVERTELTSLAPPRVQEAGFDVATLCAEVGPRPGEPPPKPYFLVVDATGTISERDRTLLASLTSEANLRVGTLRQGLRTANKHLLIVAQQDSIRRGRHTEGYHFVLEILEPHFKLRFPGAPLDFLARVRRQQEQGRWSKDDRRIVDHFYQVGSIDELGRELDRDGKNGPTSVPSTPLAVVQRGNRCPPALQRAATWLAAYMPALPAEDYRRVLAVLVHGLSEPMPAPEPPAAAPPAPAAAPAAPEQGAAPPVPPPPPPSPILLIEHWNRGYEAIMQDIGLCFRSRRTNLRSGRDREAIRVVFTVPCEDQVRRHFEGQLAFDHFRYVHRLTNAGLLFDEAPEVADAVIRICVDLARMRPEQIAHEWLLNMIVNAGPEQLVPVVAASPVTARIVMALEAMEEAQREYVYGRLSELLWEMFQHADLRAVVDRLLNDLLDIPGLHHAVLRLVRRLQTLEFDALAWMRRLIDEAAENRRQMWVPEVYQAVLELAVDRNLVTDRESLHRLEAIRRWLPERAWSYDGALPEPLTSAAFPVELMVLLAENSMTPPLPGPASANPPESVLLRLVSDPTEAGALPLVVEWLFHPCCDQVLQRRLALHLEGFVRAWLVPAPLRRHLDDGGEALEAILLERWRRTILTVKKECSPGPGHQAGRQLFHAMVLADWAVVLAGLGQEPAAQSAHVLAALVDRVVGAVDERQHQRMTAYWAEMAESLLVVIQALDDDATHGARSLRADRKVVREKLRGLRRRVRELRAQVSARRRAMRRGKAA
ncbi:MAG: hypothetical protein QM820_63605 [Minicystis sp.]